MAEAQPPSSDLASKGSTPCSPSKRIVSVTSNGWNIAQLTGKMPALQEELMALDRNGDGRIDLDELASAVEKLAENRSTIKNLRLAVALLASVVVLIVGANFGLSFATAALSQKLRTGNGNALVDSSTGVTLRTASGSLAAPYTVLDAITTSDHMTTLRYTLPWSVGQAGCQLYSEGHFTIPASIVGPRAVYGNSTRPRTYTLLEVAGCNRDGTLAQGAALEATLQANTFENRIYIFFTCQPGACQPGACNCTAAQFFDGNGTSLPMYPALNRRLLSATTSDLLTALSHNSRRSIMHVVVPGAAPPQGGKHAFSSVALVPAFEVAAVAGPPSLFIGGGDNQVPGTGTTLRGTARRSLSGRSAGAPAATDPLTFTPLPGLALALGRDTTGGPDSRAGDLVGRSRMLSAQTVKPCEDPNPSNCPDPTGTTRRRALQIYQTHLYASPGTNPEHLRFYDCVLCTFLWRQGYLADDVYSGDRQFGLIVKRYAPWVHKGYLAYGRKLVSLFHWAGDWATATLISPITQPWALTMGALVGKTHASFTPKVALEGALCFVGLAPGTLVLGVAQAVLPALLTDLLGWCMVGWIVGNGVTYRLTSALGCGWLGLLMPQAAAWAALYHLMFKRSDSHPLRSTRRE